MPSLISPPTISVAVKPQFQLMPTHNSYWCPPSFTINAHLQFERKIMVQGRKCGVASLIFYRSTLIHMSFSFPFFSFIFDFKCLKAFIYGWLPLIVNLLASFLAIVFTYVRASAHIHSLYICSYTGSSAFSHIVGWNQLGLWVGVNCTFLWPPNNV